ncbi:hypothetical protein J437_LFUL018618 [Ladona fulva]|uniref:Tyrosinase copper-binding domain-containing protein n=1 Tax=Ladona fulva TaxID=123851 RepID=A0A8K0KU96_LADFU|nr:hypothetical protein J437_LFUL018618 [Ladona fulva]
MSSQQTPSTQQTPAAQQTPSNQEQVLFLFDRPSEPFFVPKGERKGVFDIPNNDFLVDRFRPIADDLQSRFGEDSVRVPVSDITPPDLTVPLQLGRHDNFCLFLPYHREMASRLIEILMEPQNINDFVSTAVYVRDRINPYMFVYALSVAVLHRQDTRNLEIPPLVEMLPNKFVDGSSFFRAREMANVVPGGSRTPIEIPRDYTASDLDPEHRVAYFREDVGINLHHWHWHLIFPFQAPRAIVDKDRRGEIFYYMHQQITSRYNFERLCNNLGRVKRLTDLRTPIAEGYFPKLDSLVASRTYPPRPSGALLQERGENVDLTEEGGIDVLGNMVEASILSVNQNFYGNLHNLGHFLLALPHDPDNRHLESFGVMGDPTTAMRDPVFYRWHAYMDDIFQTHKRTLPRYTTDQLGYSGIRITNVEVNAEGCAKNDLRTFWQQVDVDLSRGLDFMPRGSVFARLTQLQHTPFSYRIEVNNSNNAERVGTVRIFLSPKFDERGTPMSFRDQRHLFIELDKFRTTIPANARAQVIERQSTSSSITIPFTRTFRDLEARPTGQGSLDAFNYCGCGWPQHMLIPKGSPEGFPCHLFVMISNIDGDRVEGINNEDGACTEAQSFCGIRDNRYPDRRAMGYPFDREARTGVDTLQQFITPNMAVADVRILFCDFTEPVQSNQSTSNELNM